ncbi:MAG: hypothetical protein R3E79_21035 [Caldilineaceae bacterium]
MLAATLAPDFPHRLCNRRARAAGHPATSLLIATMQPTALTTFSRHLTQLPDDLPVEFRTCQTLRQHTRSVQLTDEAMRFTDDRAPVEQVVHRIIWNFLFGQ